MKRILLLHMAVGMSIILGVTSFTLLTTPTAAQTAFPACNSVDPTDRKLVKQGEKLFKDKNAFAQQKPFRACATCHNGAGLTDNENHTVAPTGNASVTFRRSTPSLLQHTSQTGPYLWDGRASCMQQVAFGAITSPVESHGRVAGNAAGQADLDALAAYILSLKPPAPLTNLDRQKVARGKAVFEAKPCATCHAGPNFTDNQLHNHNIGDSDPGAALVGRGGQGAFDTPQLRGVRLSAPYFHNGRNGIPAGSSTRVATEPRQALRQVVDFYNAQRNLQLTEQQKNDLVEFLMSL